ncbi:MAG: EAL domain-containing protein [Gammaproteobacteria bacterium]|nr:EAL domain-containing protein [Gammaproteobacteria bacterium]
MLGGLQIYTSVGIGLSVYPDDTDQMQTLVSYADLAMYRAKSKGHNNFHYYTDDLNTVACEWMELENGMRYALQRNELFLVYQPQIHLPTGRLVGVEALVRWRHPEKGFISPDRFIPIAEQSQLIIKLGIWCLGVVGRQIKKWDAEGVHVPRVSVNISAKHLSSRQIIDDINCMRKIYNIDGDRLGIELTEHALIENVSTIQLILDEINQSGTFLSLDDFGTGYSSLGYLKQLPVNELKIDRSFIHDIADAASDIAIVKAIIVLGKTLGMTVCAEGVETIEQLSTLKSLECDHIQGYLIAKPMPADEIKNWLASYSGV